jgi:hypothetical protein
MPVKTLSNRETDQYELAFLRQFAEHLDLIGEKTNLLFVQGTTFSVRNYDDEVIGDFRLTEDDVWNFVPAQI